MTERTIAIIGAGYSGTALALNLLQHTAPTTRILLIERGGAFGLGRAYATTNPAHLLNVPAARMSAFATRPNHFHDWLQSQPAIPAQPYVPRLLFGRYLRELLDDGCRDAAGRLHLVSGQVEALHTDPAPAIHLTDGRRLDADLVVLAIGNHAPPPVLPGPAVDSPCYCGNPWSPDATTGTTPDAPILIVGTGLTMVDTVLTLLDQGHHGPILALSRRGLVPRRHVPATAATLPPRPAYPSGMLALLQCLRADAAACVAAGGTWQDAMERMRPFIQSSWIGATPQDRRRFLRHLRPWWDVHRHRIAGPVADRIDAARASGQLQVIAGHIRAATTAPAGLAIHYQPRGGKAQRTLEVARVINCTGPAINYQRIADPLVQHLLAQGLASPDPLGLGLAVTVDGALIRADGTTGPLFALGSVTRGRFWEVTSVPDIRVQCDALAAYLARHLGATTRRREVSALTA